MTLRLSHFVVIVLLIILAFLAWKHRDRIAGMFKG